MYNFPKFNKTFTYILITGIFLGIYSFFSSYYGWNRYESGEVPTLGFRMASNIPYVLTNAAFWIAIGYLFDEMRSGFIAFGVFLFVLLLNLFVFPIGSTSGVSMFMFVLKKVFYFLPYLVFGALTFKDKRMWLFLSVALVANAAFLFNYGNTLSEFLNRLFRLFFNIRNAFEIQIPTEGRGYRIIFPLSYMMNSFRLPILFLVSAQVFYSLKNNHGFLSGKTIDLSNTFSKRKATVIYFIFRLGLYAMAANVFFYMSRNFSQPHINFFQQFIFGISFITALYLISLTYRNFLTEYCLSRDNTPGGFYFLWNIPFVNIIAWLISLVTFNKTNTESERKKLFKESRWEKNNGIKVFFIIFLFLIFGTKLNSIGFRIDGSSPTEAWIYFTAGLIGFGLVLWYLSHPHGIYVIVGLAALMLLSDIFIGAVIPTSNRAGGGYYTNISNAIIYFSLFHLAFLKDVGLEDVVDNSIEDIDDRLIEEV